MQTVVISSDKGGCGKTAASVSLASCWGQGLRLLLIDLDKQGDASRWLGAEDTGAALADAVTGRRPLRDAIRETKYGIDVVPAGPVLDYVAESVAPDALSRALAPLTGTYDVLVIDCPPALSRLVLAGWTAVPEARLVVPAEGPDAVQAVRRAERAWTDAGLNPQLMSVLLTRHDRRRRLDRELLSQVRRDYGSALLEPQVRESVVVQESCACREPLTFYAPAHPVTDDFRAVAREVLHG